VDDDGILEPGHYRSKLLADLPEIQLT